MVRIRYHTKLAIFMAFLAMVYPMMLGCSQNPLGSETTSISTVTNGTEQSNNTPPPAPVTVLHRNPGSAGSNLLGDLLNSVTRLITRLLGGTISLLDVSLRVPPLALSSNTLISIDIPNQNDFVYVFGPDGLKFNLPTTITISYANANLNGIDESRIKLAWWDSNAQQWVVMPCTVNPVTNIVTGQVYHFSSYGLITDR